MKVSSLILLAAISLLVGCDDDKTGDEASKPPPPPQQGGVLGTATFKYKCLSTADAQCDFDQELGTGTGGSQYQLPAIAAGSRFGLDFELNASAPAGGPPEVAAFHPSFATSQPDGVTAVKAGKTTVGLRRGAEIVDMVDVKIMEMTDLKLFSADPQGKYEDIDISGGSVKITASFTFRFRVAPANGETVLAGAFPCLWTTSDPNIANITTPPDDNIVTVVTGTTPGTATLSVDLGGKKKDIPITVGN